MLIETVVASTALFITAVATAIALWECIRHHKDAADPETYALESIGSERLNSHLWPDVYVGTDPISIRYQTQWSSPPHDDQ